MKKIAVLVAILGSLGLVLVGLRGYGFYYNEKVQALRAAELAREEG